ncbi:MAG: response regulator transcription factor [Actinobacteria bacterium]|nr:response regulator transcription factor [Actinomycetota bacterium]
MSMSFERPENHCLGVLVAARHFPARGVEQMIRRDSDLVIVDVVRSDEELLVCAGRMNADVALVDLELPTSGGLSAAVRLLVMAPEIKIIVMTSEPRIDLLRKVVGAGLHGYLVAPVGQGMLTNAVRCVLTGGAVFPHSLASSAVGLRSIEEREAALRAQSLTKRERELLALLVEGFNSNEIAGQLFVSRHTVRTHLYNMFSKLQVHSREEAIRFAVRYELELPAGDFMAGNGAQRG